MSQPPKLIRNYSLRTLLLVLALAALPCAWLRNRYDRVVAEARAATELNRLGFLLGYEYRGYSAEGGIPWKASPAGGPAWIRDFFGADFFASPAEMLIQDRGQFSPRHYAAIGDADLAALDYFPHLRILNLKGCAVGDESISQIAERRNLELLLIHNTRFTEAGVLRLQRALPHCEIRRQTAP